MDRITLEEVEKVSVRLDKKSAEGEGAEAEEVRKRKNVTRRMPRLLREKLLHSRNRMGGIRKRSGSSDGR